MIQSKLLWECQDLRNAGLGIWVIGCFIPILSDDFIDPPSFFQKLLEVKGLSYLALTAVSGAPDVEGAWRQGGVSLGVVSRHNSCSVSLPVWLCGPNVKH